MATLAAVAASAIGTARIFCVVLRSRGNVGRAFEHGRIAREPRDYSIGNLIAPILNAQALNAIVLIAAALITTALIRTALSTPILRPGRGRGSRQAEDCNSQALNQERFAFHKSAPLLR
jgi:hypothetical protein